MRLVPVSLATLATLAPLALVQGNFVTAWLKQVGIDYVPPSPRQGTCRDCSRSEARFGFDITPTQATNPCCPTTTPTTATTSGPPTATLAPACKCGTEGAQRIVGGTQAYAGKYPWIVSLNFDSVDGSSPGGCAGTLVATQWVLTAAHCIKGVCNNGLDCTTSTLSVVLGEHDLSSSSDSADSTLGRKNVRLARIIVHESYNLPLAQANDIALLKLSESVDINRYVPACLPAASQDFTGQNGQVYGWGSTQSCPSNTAAILREVEVPIVSDAVCGAATGTATSPNSQGTCFSQAVSYLNRISDVMLCAGTAGKDACQGDSGGPLTVKTAATGQHTLGGVVSWGFDCGAPGLFGVYAEVAKFRTWIDGKIAANGAATFCPA